MKHIHTLKRVKLKGNKDVFMCVDPSCPWTRRREYLAGKKFICPLCGGEYLISAAALRLKLPHCRDCTTELKTQIFHLDKITGLLNRESERKQDAAD